MSRAGIFFILFLGWAAALSGQTILKGKIRNLPLNAARQLAVEYWDVDRWISIQSINVQPDGSFEAPVTAPVTAQARLRVQGKPKSWSDFILPAPGKQDSLLLFDLDFNRMYGRTAQVEGSRENDLYGTIQREYRRMERLRDSLDGLAQPLPDSVVRNFNRVCSDIARGYRGFFAADVAARLFYQPNPADYPADSGFANLPVKRFLQARYFDKTPFENEQILHHNEFRKKLDRYAALYDNLPENNPKIIDGIMSRRNGNETVDAFLFHHLLEQMMGQQDEPGLTYLLNWYAPDCPDEKKSEDGMANLIAAFRNCTPGKQAFDLALPDPDGRLVSLNEVCARNKLTLLFFWRTTCSACSAFEPELERLYEKYHPLGLEVYAVSLDASDNDWRGFLAQHGQKWVQLYAPREQRTSLAQQFPAPGTPTLIALDRDRKVLSRLLDRSRLDEYLGRVLR